MSKALILTLSIGASSLFAWCESGAKIKQDFLMGGGYRVVYYFSGGKTLALRYEATEMIDAYIRYDFDQMKFCQ